MSKTKDLSFCPSCDASLATASKFCGNCGHATRKHKREVAGDFAEKSAQDQKRTAALASVFLGILVAITAAYLSSDKLGLSDIGSDIVLTVGELIAGALAINFLGKQSFRQSLGRAPSAGDLMIALLLPVLTLTAAFAYVALLWDIAEEPVPKPAMTASAFLLVILLTAVQPAIIEEWLCRGVLWVTIRPITSRWTAILVTAVIFAALHGLNGGYLLELPHRFVMGLALGWLRAHSGSLWPCVLAHFVHNTAAVMIG